MTHSKLGGPIRMFKSIRLQNVKAYKDSGEIPLAPLTVLVGANNSGKSTILQAILLLAQTIEDPSRQAPLVTNGQLVELNGFYDILRGRGREENWFGISLALDSVYLERIGKRHLFARRGEVLADKLDLSFTLSAKAKKIKVRSATVWANNKKLIAYRSKKRWSSDVFPLLPSDHTEIEMEKFMPTVGWHPTSRARDELLQQIGLRSRIARNVWFMALGSVHRVEPLRSHMPWYIGVGTRASSDAGTSGPNLIASLGSDQRSYHGGKRTLLDEVNVWVSNKLGILGRLHVRNLDESGTVRELLGDERHGMMDINVAAMGEGVSQVLPIISRSIEGSRVECLVVEQPEIHLHPRLQTNLADLFIEVAEAGRRQIILETHSEHILLRIRRRIAEGKLHPDGVAVLFIEKEGAEATVRRLSLNENGHFTDWPKGFFEEAYQEAMALAMASRG